MFTREFIKNKAKECDIELPKEFVDAIVEKHIESRDTFADTKVKDKLKEIDFDNIKKEYDELKQNKSSGDEWKTKFEAKEKELKDYKASVDQEKTNAIIIKQLKTGLKEAGANEKFIDRMLKGYDTKDIKLKDEKIEALEDLVKGFKEGEWADVFGTTEEGNANTGNGGNNNNPIDLDKMSMTEYAEYRNKK